MLSMFAIHLLIWFFFFYNFCFFISNFSASFSSTESLNLSSLFSYGRLGWKYEIPWYDQVGIRWQSFLSRFEGEVACSAFSAACLGLLILFHWFLFFCFLGKILPVFKLNSFLWALLLFSLSSVHDGTHSMSLRHDKT